jgi:hypothetical protein
LAYTSVFKNLNGRWEKSNEAINRYEPGSFKWNTPPDDHYKPAAWVGLTDEDMEELSSAWWKPNENEMALIDWVEAKLKEKNT